MWVRRWQQAPKDWALGPIGPCHSEAVMGGREAKTTRERVACRQGHTVQLTMAMGDAMTTLGWAVVLPVCEQPMNDLPSDTCLHRLLVSVVDIHMQVELPLHACLQEHLRVATLPQPQASGTEGPTMVWHRTPPRDRNWEWVSRHGTQCLPL